MYEFLVGSIQNVSYFYFPKSTVKLRNGNRSREMLIFNLEKDVMSLSINTEIPRALIISQCVEAKQDGIFFDQLQSQS